MKFSDIENTKQIPAFMIEHATSQGVAVGILDTLKEIFDEATVIAKNNDLPDEYDVVFYTNNKLVNVNNEVFLNADTIIVRIGLWLKILFLMTNSDKKITHCVVLNHTDICDVAGLLPNTTVH